MANQAKKSNAGSRNSDRRNGKAWKKNPAKPKVRSEERQEKDALIRGQRAVKRQEGMVRHAAEEAAKAEKNEFVQGQHKTRRLAFDVIAELAVDLMGPIDGPIHPSM